jgi:secreted PhoX family phosphatase
MAECSRSSSLRSLLPATLAALAVATALAQNDPGSARGSFQFEPLPAPATCNTTSGEQPFILPPGYVQAVIAREGDGGSTDEWDQNTVNETGAHPGTLLYRAHETAINGQVTVTDLTTGVTRVLAQRPDWNRLDGTVWTPWRTILTGEELRRGRTPFGPDPAVPQALAGLIYEIDPDTGVAVARPALGAKPHEGIRLDPQGNVYGISETAPVPVPPAGPGGYIFKFVPDRRGDLSSGQLYALKVIVPTGDRTGDAIWLPLDRADVQVDADQAATEAGATGYTRPEDIEIATDTGNARGGNNILWVAVTGEHRVLRVDLRERAAGAGHDTAFVSDYVRAGVNAPADFENPDNLALDKNGNLYIAEDQDEATGDDIWVAIPDKGNHATAAQTVRFASLQDCVAEPSGIYFDKSGTILYVNVQHRGAPDRRDLGMIIMEAPKR